MTDNPWFIVMVAIVGGALRVSTPFMFVALGECLTEKSGRVNLGLEGTLVLGAMCAYAVSYHTGSPWFGVIAAGFSGACLGGIHGYVCKLPRVNDIAIGIAMMLFGTGLAFFFGKAYIQPSAPRLSSFSLGSWTGSSQVETALQINPLLLVGIATAGVLAWAFANTKWGLIVRMTGDSAPAARAMVLVDDDRRISRRRRWRVPVALLSRFVEPGPVVGTRSDGGRARDLRALEPDPLRVGGVPVRRSGRDRSGAAVDRHFARLLLLQRGALHPHVDHHDGLGGLEARGARRAGRVVDYKIAKRRRAVA